MSGVPQNRAASSGMRESGAKAQTGRSNVMGASKDLCVGCAFWSYRWWRFTGVGMRCVLPQKRSGGKARGNLKTGMISPMPPETVVSTGRSEEMMNATFSGRLSAGVISIAGMAEDVRTLFAVADCRVPSVLSLSALCLSC